MASPFFADAGVALFAGDCLDVLAGLPDASVDAVVTDPPYELGFMGRAWDASGIAYNVEVWRQCLRVLRPGGHLVAFGGTRTYHRLTVAIEDAGFEIRDSLHWIYGSGFPKSLDVGKAIDKAAGATREVVATIPDRWAGKGDVLQRATQEQRAEAQITAPATDAARRWQGWGTALKPAHEPVVLARKPLGGTVAASVLAHGTGALNVDGCRVGMSNADRAIVDKRSGADDGEREIYQNGVGRRPIGERFTSALGGRWPANVVLSHPPALDAAGVVVGDACADGCVDGCPVAEMDAQSGVTRSRASAGRNGNDTASATFGLNRTRDEVRGHDDAGGASRFFPIFRYQAKAPKSERPRLADGTSHPTVKPLALMRWLVTLVTPPDGVVLDPFAGSGATLEAARGEGFRTVGVELDERHCRLVVKRLTGVDPAEPAAS